MIFQKAVKISKSIGQPCKVQTLDTKKGIIMERKYAKLCEKCTKSCKQIPILKVDRCPMFEKINIEVANKHSRNAQ